MRPPAPPPVVRLAWPWLRLVGGFAVLGALVWHFGTGPFTQAWQVTTWPAVVGALLVTAGATLTSTWRWRTVARAFGVPLGRRDAVTSYYRSQFLNATLPGGILGDAHRAVRHGRHVGDVGAGVRATVWERGSGQVVQVGLLVVALTALSSPLRPLLPVAVALAVVVGGAGWFALRHRGRVSADLHAVLNPGTASRVAAASCGSSLAHLAVFLIAAHAVGVHASWRVLVTLGLVVMVGSAIPLNIAGWGPREGLTAWAFGMARLGAAVGLTVSVVYGVLAAVATLPGALVLVGDAVGRRSRAKVEVQNSADVDELGGVTRG